MLNDYFGISVQIILEELIGFVENLRNLRKDLGKITNRFLVQKSEPLGESFLSFLTGRK